MRRLAVELSKIASDLRLLSMRHGVRDRVECVQGDLLTPLTGRFDLIVANPPYVAVGSRTALQPEVRNFEPETALFGGTDGLEIIRRLVRGAPACLNQDGYLMFEFGDGQEADVSELIAASEDLRLVDVKRDLQGIERIAIVRPKTEA